MSENKIEKPENMAESETYKTGEKARFIVKNGDDVVSIDNYLNAKYLIKNKT